MKHETEPEMIEAYGLEMIWRCEGDKSHSSPDCPQISAAARPVTTVHDAGLYTCECIEHVPPSRLDLHVGDRRICEDQLDVAEREYQRELKRRYEAQQRPKNTKPNAQRPRPMGKLPPSRNRKAPARAPQEVDVIGKLVRFAKWVWKALKPKLRRWRKKLWKLAKKNFKKYPWLVIAMVAVIVTMAT